MTTPNGGPLPTPIYNTPAQIMGQQPTGTTVLILNMDDNDNIFVGRNSGITQANTLLIAPGASVIYDASRPVWAFTDSATPPVIAMVAPGTTQYNLGPQQIVDTLDIAALAAAIAVAINNLGIPPVAAPVPLYGGTAPRTGAAFVGATVDRFAYLPNTSNDEQQMPVWDTKTGRPYDATARRTYIQEGDTPTSPTGDGGSTTSAGNGFALATSWKPFRDPTNVYGNNHVPGQGSLTFAQHLTALKASVVYIQSIAVHGLTACLWHECNGNGPNGPFGSGGGGGYPVGSNEATNYITYFNFYIQAFRKATNAPLTADVRTSYVPALFSPNNVLNFYPGPANLNEIDPDYYVQDFNSKPTTVPASRISLQAQAAADGLAYGGWEIGLTNGSTNPSVATTNSWFTNEMIGPAVANLNAGRANGYYIFFAAPKDATSSPSRNAFGGGTGKAFDDPSVIANQQSMFDQLSPTPSPVLTIAPGATVTLAPLTPSPGAGYAIALSYSYDITINTESTGTPTTPWAQVQVQWFNNDIPNAQPVDTQVWTIPIANNATAGAQITGIGPQKGQFMQIQITNLDTVSANFSVLVNSTARPVTNDKWKWDVVSSPQIHGYNMASAGGNYSNSLGSVSSQSVPASGQKKFLFGMAAGDTYVRLNSASAQINYVGNLEPTSVFGSAGIFNQTPNTEFELSLIQPRAAISITANNNDAGAAHNVNEQLMYRDN